MQYADVRFIRENLGLSQEDFARRLGLSVFTISRWERGVAQPSRLAFKQLEKLMAEMATATS